MVNTARNVNAAEMGYLLEMVSVATRRKFSNEEGSIWLHLLAHNTYDECHEAFTHYLRSMPDVYLTPSTIETIIKQKRKDRWRANGDSEQAPNFLSGKEYLEWLEERKRLILAPPVAPLPDGSVPHNALSSDPTRKAIGN